MKAIISTTYDNKYLYFLPITTWVWSKLGVDVICFMPYLNTSDENKRIDLINDTFKGLGIKPQYAGFYSPEHKTATYAQVSRLFGACLDMPEDEVVITADIDMAVFRTDFFQKPAYDFFDIYGVDLVPEGQLPICYAIAYAKTWRKFFTEGRTYQECLDAELAHEECENMRGNLWSRDQELLFKGVGPLYFGHERAKPGTQFASLRVDRDNAYWRENLTPDLIDAHLWRDGFEERNFSNILELLANRYPQEDFTWLVNYTNEYRKLL